MGKSLAMKILEQNLLTGQIETGQDIDIKVNQTLTQDSTGTMVYLQLGALDPDQIKTDLSVAYIDHNTLQSGFENADDHDFIKTSAEKYGLIFSKPGGGICHQVHLENFAKPGTVLLGSDSHTPTAGGLGAIAIGAGGLDVAIAMATGTYQVKVPKVRNVILKGELKHGVNGKDVILKVLEQLSVKGGVGYIIEYSGDGVKSLSVTDRATICNMGAELGATTSIFPSDENTRDFLIRQGREEDYRPLAADDDAYYDETIEIDLAEIDPLAAAPHSPDNIENITDLSGKKVDQVIIGSCTNSSYTDLMKAAKILEGKKVHPDVSLAIAPGSASILKILAENGAIATFISAGARILESACGPCIGMGQSPKTGAVSLRTFNRNFKGRSGTMDADVYLVSPEVAAISAIEGMVADPTELGLDLNVEEPSKYEKVNNYFIYSDGPDKSVEVSMGPNIKPFPLGGPLEDSIKEKLILKVGDNITTDDIAPSNAKLLPYRSNVPHLAKFAFTTLVDDFYQRAIDNDGGIIVGGDNYGQGSSREHAALIPLHLGVKAIVAESFARIHKANLINSGILPLVFENPEDYSKVKEYDQIEISDLKKGLEEGKLEININSKESIPVLIEISDRDKEILLAGGKLNYVKEKVN